MLQEHSASIFANACSITTVNEDNSLEGLVYGLAALSSVEVNEVVQRTLNGIVKVTFQIEGLGERHFELEDSKYPDVTPALEEMNSIAKTKNLGRYIVVSEGSSDSEIFAFARRGDASRKWRAY